MQIQMDTVAPILSTANLILNAVFDDALVPPPSRPSRPKTASAVVQRLHNNQQIYLVYFVHNSAFVFHYYIGYNSQHSLYFIIHIRDNGRVYVGQTISPHKQLRQHVQFPSLKMRGNATLYVPFAQHFYMDVVYTTTQKYLADRKKKQLIRINQSKPLRSYNIMRGHPLADPLYWMLKRKSINK